MAEQIFAIELLSKHTGETCWLGIAHPTREAAREYAEREVCPRCNRYEIWTFPAGWRYVDRHCGFKENLKPKGRPRVPKKEDDERGKTISSRRKRDEDYTPCSSVADGTTAAH